MARNILVTGATGKQGSAFIRTLLQPSTSSSPNQNDFHIYALTRKSGSPSAQKLTSAFGTENLTLVEGNLDNRASILRIFEDLNGRGGVWGVFTVLAFPGLGQKADGEEAQGKMLAGLALEYAVKVFVYSSAMRAGPKYEDQLDNKPSGEAKKRIENYCMKLGEKGLNWIILRPGFFMENFDDLIGSIAVSVLKSGLKDDTTLGLIASEDIGNVAAGVFRNHTKYLHQTLVLVSEFATMTQIQGSYCRAAGKAIPAVPGAFAWLLVKMNKAIGDLIKDIEQSNHARANGEYPEVEGEIALANSAYKMKTYYEWMRHGNKGEGQEANWNQVSLGKLLTGRH